MAFKDAVEVQKPTIDPKLFNQLLPEVYTVGLGWYNLNANSLKTGKVEDHVFSPEEFRERMTLRVEQELVRRGIPGTDERNRSIARVSRYFTEVYAGKKDAKPPVLMSEIVPVKTQPQVQFMGPTIDQKTAKFKYHFSVSLGDKNLAIVVPESQAKADKLVRDAAKQSKIPITEPQVMEIAQKINKITAEQRKHREV